MKLLSYITSRFRRTLSVLLLLSLLLIPLRALAVSADQLQKVLTVNEGRAALSISEDNTADYRTLPPGVSKVAAANADKVGVEIKGTRFMLDHVEHNDRKQAQDSYDFIFTPVLDGKRVGGPLKFIYRSSPGRGNSNAVIVGLTNDGFDIKDNRVTGLSGFGGTPLAKALDANDTSQGVQDLNVTHSTNTGKSSNFLQGGNSDPFQQAVQKLAEIVTSVNSSIVKALISVMDIGPLSDIPGINQAWKVVRDLINILFIIALLALSILTILRIDPQRYSIRSILPLLVFAIITVNFSLFFATIIADTAAVLAHPLITSAQELVSKGSTFQSTLTDGSAASFGESVVMLLAAIIMLIALVILLFFFIVRIIVIWLLAAVSPVVFLFMVLPLTRGESTKLLTTWIKWVYMAPISFLILFIAAQAAFPSVSVPDRGGSAILSAIFYAGVVLAAVLLPLALGGTIMNIATKHGRRAAGLGGKHGLGLLGGLPTGRGMSVGEMARSGKAALKQRSDAQQERAALRAAAAGGELHRMLGGGGLAEAVTGRDLTQAKSATQALVDDTRKKMVAIGFQDEDARQVIGYTLGRVPASDLTREQLAYADSHVGQLASAQILAENGWWDAGIARAYAHTGYQSQIKGDPIWKNLKRQHYAPDHQFTRDDFNEMDIGIAAGSMDGDDMRKLYPTFWRYNNPDSDESRANPAGHAIFTDLISDRGLGAVRENGQWVKGRTLNPTSFGQNVDTNHRNVASPSKRTAELATYARAGNKIRLNLIAGNLSAREWESIPGGPQTRDKGREELGRLQKELGLQTGQDHKDDHGF